MSTSQASSTAIAESWSSSETPGYPWKRTLDIAGSLGLLTAAAPVLLVVAIAVKLTSAGPVFFRQRRLGLHERPFTILKFRSMRRDASRTGPAFTAENDPRVTRVGRILRRTSLDELPQLFNVLFGEMSLFGPRPYAGFELESWTPEQRAARASVRPGISGLAQANGRSTNTTEDARRYDLAYVRNCSFSLDCRIMWQTLRTVLAIRGTN